MKATTVRQRPEAARSEPAKAFVSPTAVSHIGCFLLGVVSIFIWLQPGFQPRADVPTSVHSITRKSAGEATLVDEPVWGASLEANHSTNSEASTAQPISRASWGTAKYHSGTPSRMIILPHSGEDTSWLDLYFGDIPHIIYQLNDKSTLHKTSTWKGREALAYLQYIVEHYEDLPDSMAFMHPHRSAWHMEDKVPVLRRLRWGEVEFANLRHTNISWACGIFDQNTGEKTELGCSWNGLELHPGDPEVLRKRVFRDPVKRMTNGHALQDSVQIAQVWQELYGWRMGPLPPVISAPCCAEFLVSRERVLRHPLAFYESLRQWTMHNEAFDGYQVGRVFEYTWHILFGEPAVVKPIEECKLLRCHA